MPKGKLFTLLIFFLPLYCIAQTNGNVPLTAILRHITKAYNVKISYIDDEIALYSLAPPDNDISLEAAFGYIEKKTRLRFEAVSPGYYVAYNDISAQKPLCGHIINPGTGTAIPNALVALSGTAIKVSTDEKGYFSLPPVTGKISISHVGYRTAEIDAVALYVPPCPVFYMEQLPIQLQEVLAQRYLASGISKKNGGQLVIKPQKFGILPGMTEPDVLQTMQQLPGVISADETVSNINVRGGTHDQNLFLWNGIRMFQTSHFFGLISAFNPLPATTISIYKNGSPAVYGESVSSLIDISTHTQPQDSAYSAFAADMLTVNAVSHVRLSPKGRLQVAARRSFTDALTTPTYKSYRERIFQNTTITDVLQNEGVPIQTREKFYFYDLSFSYSHAINKKHTFLIDGIGIANSLSILQANASARRYDSLLQRSLGGSAAMVSKWGAKTTSEMQVYASVYDVNASNESIENEQITHQGNTIFDKGARFKYGYDLLPELDFSAGYQYNEISVKNFDEVNIPAYSKNEKVVSRSHAFNGEVNYSSKKGSSKLYAGLRGTYFDKYTVFLLEPRVVFTQKLYNAVKLEVSAERKSQTVSQVIDLQQDFLGIEKRRWVLSNDNDIPIQKSKQAAVGLNYSENGWYCAVEGFYKKISGIASNSQGFQNQFEFTESTGYYTVTGLEFLLQKRFGSFYTWASYSYNDNHYYFYGFVPPGFSNNFAIPHAVTAAGTYEWNNLRAALGAKWRSGTPFTTPVSYFIDPDNPANSHITYSSPNNSRLEDNVQVNFSLSKTWHLNSRSLFTASCSILNLLNTKNGINRYYRINKSNNNIESVDTYGLKRTPNVSVKLVF
ncbi:carboxypeptidase-like regulatory domain-containing protein [Flavobacterium sp. RHBU_24]|uniref:TonB-dependent receptor n=1 Tax=Flavobacterium sp. RHBU_24 TaxID=3391185 RepID=UPI0039847517